MESNVQNVDGLTYLNTLESGTVDLVLTDPPYITSRKTGMDEHAKLVKQLEETNINAKNESDWEALKTSEEWDAWMIKNGIPEETRDKKLASLKADYLK